MEEADVAEAIATLESQGKTPSIGNLHKLIGHGSLRDITKHRKKLRPYMGRTRHMDKAQTAIAPAAPTAVVEPPPTLLEQAEAAYQAALMAERRARRDVDMAPRAERERLEQAWRVATREREHAALLVSQRQRARDTLKAAIGPARIAYRRAASELAVLEDESQRRLIRARREAQQAQEDLSQMVRDLVAIAGAQAVPKED
jgi:hypothetical protein